MAYIEFNNNPTGRRVGDCAVRAVAKALGMGWEAAYIALVINGIQMGDVISSNSVWGSVLRKHGFYRKAVPDTCPDCYTIEDFAEDHKDGTFVVGTGNHVVTIIDGDWYDSWDSGSEVAQYYWCKNGQDDRTGE